MLTKASRTHFEKIALFLRGFSSDSLVLKYDQEKETLRLYMEFMIPETQFDNSVFKTSHYYIFPKDAPKYSVFICRSVIIKAVMLGMTRIRETTEAAVL